MGKSTNRLGARYGRTVKNKLEKIERKQKASYVCPVCAKTSVKRLATGIWYCDKCDTKMAGKAYEL